MTNDIVALFDNARALKRLRERKRIMRPSRKMRGE
jgi:hypothetical protein